MAISAAFAAPCIHLAGAASFGIHLVRMSSKGKTTLLDCAGSVCGGGDNGYHRTWLSTSNGLEGTAAVHNDTLLVIDELGQVTAPNAATVAYMLANGTGKSRANRDGSARVPATWNLIFLSSGEITLSDKIKEDGRRAPVGTAVRLVDLRADGQKYGAFEDLHDKATGNELSIHLVGAAGCYYGTAKRAFLERITGSESDVADISRALRTSIAQFANEVAKDGDGQVIRVGRNFGLIAAAGELATALGVSGWSAGDAESAAAQCFASWRELRSSGGPAELDAGVAHVRKFFEAHGESRFSRSDQRSSLPERTTINRAGSRRTLDDGGQYLVLPQVLGEEILAGFDRVSLLQELVKRGLLEPDRAGKTSQSVFIPALGKQARVYVFNASVIQGGEESDAQ